MNKFKLNGAMNALSASPDATQVIVAGRDVLRILNVASTLSEDLNLRTGRTNLNHSSNDVKWCPIPYCKNIIATAATNGAIVIWDLYKDGQKSDRVINEHTRAVNRICFHPQDPIILLSASQDGTTKLWDLRDHSQAKLNFEGKAESVRDVQFSPVDPFVFATAFENGTIQTWDQRNPSKFVKRIAGHNGPVFTIDWHPNGRYIATGSRDKTIKIWDLKSDLRKPQTSIQTISAVGRVQWRPNHPFQLASCALLTDRRILIWDLKRSFIPLYSLDNHDDCTTSIVWKDQDTIWSCSKDQYFIQNSIEEAYRNAEMYRSSSISWNVEGQMSFTNRIPDYSENFGLDETPESQSTFTSIFRPGKTSTRSKLVSPEKAPQELKSLQYAEYKPNQLTGTIDTGFFSSKSFILFASQYQLDGESQQKMCDINMKVAENAGELEVARFWKIIKLFVTEQRELGLSESPSPMRKFSQLEANKSKDSIDAGAVQNLNMEPPNGFLSPDSSDEETDFLTSISEDPNFQTISHQLEGLEPQSEDFQTTSTPAFIPPLVFNWNHSQIVLDLLNYFAEQGDMQMCVTVVLILKGQIEISKEKEKQWFYSYIELLQRFKLWTVAAKIITLSRLPEIQSLSQESTTIHTSCNYCRKPMLSQDNGYHVCGKCQKLVSQCSICHERVRGLFVWCQGCSHGGHQAHMRSWFSTNTTCPTGCGHQCSF